jgi:hypothetical protein
MPFLSAILVKVLGDIIRYRLNSPFAYLQSIAEDYQNKEEKICGSEQLPPGVFADNGVFIRIVMHIIQYRNLIAQSGCVNGYQ